MEFNLHKDVINHSRSIYSFLDLLGDVGGLFDALTGIFSLVVSLSFSVFGNPLNAYLLKAVFLRNPKHSNDANSYKSVPIKNFLQALSKRKSFELPRVLCSCMRSREDKRLIDKGLERIDNELEIDEFLKT